MVFLNQDFAGRGKGGGVLEFWEVSVVCRVVKSEYRFWSVHDRSGWRRVIVYKV